MLSELCKYVGRNVFLYCSAGKMIIVSELLKLAESIDQFWRQGGRLVSVCVCGGGRGGAGSENRKEGARGRGRDKINVHTYVYTCTCTHDSE